MAKQKTTTSQGPTAEQMKLLETYYALPPEDRDAFMAKQRKQRTLIQLDFHEIGIEEKLVELLDMARAGELSGLVFAARLNDKRDEYIFGCEGRPAYNRAEAIGAAVLLQNKIAGTA